MKASEYMAKVDKMENDHLAWLEKYKPVRISAEKAQQGPAEKVWIAGYLDKTGEYLILTGGVYSDSWAPVAYYFSQEPVVRIGDDFIVYREEAPCLVCNSGFDDDLEDTSNSDPNCSNCEGTGWAVFDCIETPDYEALMNEIEDSDDEDWTDYLTHYLEMHGVSS